MQRRASEPGDEVEKTKGRARLVTIELVAVLLIAILSIYFVA